MNNAPVSGFERDAGSRTTIRLMYPEGAPHSPREYLHTPLVVLVVFKSLDLDWLTSIITKQPLVGMVVFCSGGYGGVLLWWEGCESLGPEGGLW